MRPYRVNVEVARYVGGYYFCRSVTELHGSNCIERSWTYYGDDPHYRNHDYENVYWNGPLVEISKVHECFNK